MSNIRRPRVYLAGPGVFRPDAVRFGELLKSKCERAGLVGCFPLDNEILHGSPREQAEMIYRANVALIDNVQAVIADISPFRGPNMDPGTAWEIGYGIAKGLRVYAWSSDPTSLAERTSRLPGAVAKGEGFVDGDGWTIENFGLIDNLMIAVSSVSIYRSDDEAIAACAARLRA
jgi:nucleoside 2-deoxyribosyltransferase